MEHSNQIISRTRRNKQQIQDLLNEFEQSNLSAKDFCKKHHISRPNFHKWKSRYTSNRVIKNKNAGFAAVEVVDSSTVLRGLFAEVKGIRIYQPVSASFLRELLA